MMYKEGMPETLQTYDFCVSQDLGELGEREVVDDAKNKIDNRAN
jgi:hypothetical protein